MNSLLINLPSCLTLTLKENVKVLFMLPSYSPLQLPYSDITISRKLKSDMVTTKNNNIFLGETRHYFVLYNFKIII